MNILNVYQCKEAIKNVLLNEKKHVAKKVHTVR